MIQFPDIFFTLPCNNQTFEGFTINSKITNMAEKSYRQLSTPDGTTPVLEKPTEATNDAPKDAPDDHEYPGTLSLMAIMTALYLAIFLVALVSLPISIHQYMQCT